MPVVTLEHVALTFGSDPLLADATLRVERGERISVVGRNGSGKSSLLRIIGGELTPDTGKVWTEPGLRVARLEQLAGGRERRRLPPDRARRAHARALRSGRVQPAPG